MSKLNYEDKLDEASYVLECFDTAAKYGLESEVMMFFIRYLRTGNSPTDAINGAMCEWDIA